MSYIEIDDDTQRLRTFCSGCGETVVVGQLVVKNGLIICPKCGKPL